MVMPGLGVLVLVGVVVVLDVRLADVGLEVGEPVGVPAGLVAVAAVGEVVGVVRGFDRDAVEDVARGSGVSVAPTGDPVAEVVGVPVCRPSAAGPESAFSAAPLGSMKANTPTAVRPPIQTRTRLGSGFQLPPLVTE
jgi:hypothetical protein